MTIGEKFRNIRDEIPENVTIVGAVKTRTPDEVSQAIEAGLTEIGENYVQEAESLYITLGAGAKRVRWHMIGHLQTNKINKALELFDVVQTIDSLKKADAVNRRAAVRSKVIPVYIEINIGSELTKSGLSPDYSLIKNLIQQMSGMEYVRVEGLMTMGPITGDPEDVRPYFRKAREIFDRLCDLDLPHTDIKTLSMGMSNSYKVAIEEGSTMVRLGTVLFGERTYR
jgi:pyridoxal phosphate enzyme (YggS family)